MNFNNETVAIIGAGPAGMAAALQLYRLGINFFLFEDQKHQSLLKNAWLVDNYLGVYPGKNGVNILQLFQKTLDKNKIKKIKEKVISLDYDSKSKLFEIKTSSQKYNPDYVVVASGTKPKFLDINLMSGIKSRLFYDVFPLLKIKEKTIIIIGAGDAAFDNALNLAKNNKVIVCNRTKDSNALPLLINKASEHRNITYLCNYKLGNLTYSSSSKTIECKFANRGKDVYMNADYLLVAIGRLPQKDFYSKKLNSFEDSLIKNEKLFLAGDVKNSIYRQVAIATGDGIKTAMNIYNDLV